jgi:NAD(P)-dependent dehydrogenase (short-subunit alcohol dehydrogenase family)
MTRELKNKVIIVTGGTSGMGKAIVQLFAGRGASVVVAGRNRERGEALVASLKNSSGNVVFVPTDVSIPADNKRLVQEALANFGKIDILSLNAGILGLGAVTDLPVESWQHTLETNLSSIFYLCKYAIPELLKNKKGVIIINASIAAFKSFPNHPAYCATKAAAVALTKQMALEYGPYLRVNTICPGPVDTPLLRESAAAFKHPAEAVARAKNATLLKRLGQPGDIAELVFWLASDRASWITGTAFTIDGGILNS